MRTKHRQGRYDYPFLECDYHPGKQRSYVCCIHVAREGGVKAALIEKATDKAPGVLMCQECVDEGQPKDLHKFVPICEGCAINHKLLGWEEEI